jgi:hypothetical protein
MFVYQEHRYTRGQYIPCFSDEVKLNYPKKSSLNAEQQALYLQLVTKYAKKCSVPTAVEKKELQQYEVCVLYIMYTAGVHKFWLPAHVGSLIFVWW